MTKCFMALAVLLAISATGSTDIVVIDEPGRHIVQYESDTTVYVEEFSAGRLMSRCWSCDGRSVPENRWFAGEDAFEIRIKERPSPANVLGTLLFTRWQWVDAQELSRLENGSREFMVELSSKAMPVTVKVHTLLDGTPVLTRWLEITNNSEKSIALTSCYPWTSRLWPEDAPMTLGYLTKWVPLAEGWFGWKPLENGTNIVKSGNKYAMDDPIFILRNESSGQYFFGQLAWTPNWSMEFEKTEGLSFKIGPKTTQPLRVLAPGETIHTPAVHLACIEKDFNTAIQAMHDHVRRSVLPKRQPGKSYLIQAVNPADGPAAFPGAEFTESNMRKSIDVAAALGCELFLVDYGWWEEYGNWVPSKRSFPNGFKPLVDYAHEKGLLIGAYGEVEAGRGNWAGSKAYKEHPEWFILGNPDMNNCDWINLANPEIAHYVESELYGLIDRLGIDLYRHDHNGGMFLIGQPEGTHTLRDGFLENDYWRYYQNLYAISARTREKYPDLILQQASGGGYRLDLGMVGQWHEQFGSDMGRLPQSLQISAGLSVYLPPETVVMPWGHTFKTEEFETIMRGAFCLGNTPMLVTGFLPKTLDDITPDITRKFRHYTDLYKSYIRPLMATCKVYHLAPINATGGVETGDWFAMEFVSSDCRQGWALVVRIADSGSDTYDLKLKGLNARADYAVTSDNSGSTDTIKGATLMSEGLRVKMPDGKGCSSELLLFTAR